MKLIKYSHVNANILSMLIFFTINIENTNKKRKLTEAQNLNRYCDDKRHKSMENFRNDGNFTNTNQYFVKEKLKNGKKVIIIGSSQYLSTQEYNSLIFGDYYNQCTTINPFEISEENRNIKIELIEKIRENIQQISNEAISQFIKHMHINAAKRTQKKNHFALNEIRKLIKYAHKTDISQIKHLIGHFFSIPQINYAITERLQNQFCNNSICCCVGDLFSLCLIFENECLDYIGNLFDILCQKVTFNTISKILFRMHTISPHLCCFFLKKYLENSYILKTIEDSYKNFITILIENSIRENKIQRHCKITRSIDQNQYNPPPRVLETKESTVRSNSYSKRPMYTYYEIDFNPIYSSNIYDEFQPSKNYKPVICSINNEEIANKKMPYSSLQIINENYLIVLIEYIINRGIQLSTLCQEIEEILENIPYKTYDIIVALLHKWGKRTFYLILNFSFEKKFAILFELINDCPFYKNEALEIIKICLKEFDLRQRVRIFVKLNSMLKKHKKLYLFLFELIFPSFIEEKKKQKIISHFESIEINEEWKDLIRNIMCSKEAFNVKDMIETIASDLENKNFNIEIFYPFFLLNIDLMVNINQHSIDSIWSKMLKELPEIFNCQEFLDDLSQDSLCLFFYSIWEKNFNFELFNLIFEKSNEIFKNSISASLIKTESNIEKRKNFECFGTFIHLIKEQNLDFKQYYENISKKLNNCQRNEEVAPNEDALMNSPTTYFYKRLNRMIILS